MKKYLVISDIGAKTECVVEIVEAESVEQADSIAWEKYRETGFLEGNYELLEIRAGKLYRDGKKLPKKDVYAAFGITYENGKIMDPFREMVSPLIPYGTNEKVGNAGTWSIYHGNEELTPETVHPKVAEYMRTHGIGKTCGSCPCHCKGCYCDSGNYKRYPDNMVRAMRKLVYARYYTDWMTRAIIAQIFADSIDQTRIHAEGDFFLDEYVSAWKKISDVTIDICRYWTYSKEESAVDAFRNSENVSLVPSITPEGINFGTCAELLRMYDKLTASGYRVHICACGTPYEKHCADCETGCKYVGEKCDYVLFIKHSCPDYKAGEKDTEEYERVLEIVRSQDN